MKNQDETSAEIVADSISEDGVRITTYKLRYPRLIHQELLTHRVFSRNASSSRAIPVVKMLRDIWNNPAGPIRFEKNQKGMQSKEPLDGWRKTFANLTWDFAAKSSVSLSYILHKIGVHKQFANRITEPFQYIDVLVTATEFDNWFWLRDHEDAQPEIKHLARKMKKARMNSDPKVLKKDEWHLPFITEKDWRDVESNWEQQYKNDFDSVLDVLLRCSTARCARVSYRNHDQSEPSIKKDLSLYNMLVVEEPPHASPAEHQATPMSESELDLWGEGMTHIDKDNNRWSNNFRGWYQHRALLDV